MFMAEERETQSSQIACVKSRSSDDRPESEGLAEPTISSSSETFVKLPDWRKKTPLHISLFLLLMLSFTCGVFMSTLFSYVR